MECMVHLESIGTLENTTVNNIPFFALIASGHAPAELATELKIPEERISVVAYPDMSTAAPVATPTPTSEPEIRVETAGANPEPEKEERKAHPVAVVQAAPPAPVKVPAPQQAVAKPELPLAQASDSTLRINVSLLDTLMNLAGEMVLGRNQLLQSITKGDANAIKAAGYRVNTVTSELQEAIMMTRMQPIGTVFNRFTRVVRDMSRDLGKEITLAITGKEVELDKTIIEGLSDPLTHLVRNAVDHGIESQEKRRAAGKSANGAIQLNAFHEAGQVIIEIIDDGGGIDPEKIANSAVTKGLITLEQARSMSDKEKRFLIMMPGFSTAEVITDISGRGVGMDVVKNNIEKLNGVIEIDSEIGKGSIFRIKLPLTLAIIPSLFVEADGQAFAIPQANVIETIRIEASKIRERIERVTASRPCRQQQLNYRPYPNRHPPLQTRHRPAHKGWLLPRNK